MNRKQQALVVDDEPDIRELIEITLSRMGVESTLAADIGTAKSLVDTDSFDFCLTDLKLPDGDGIDLVEYIQEKNHSLPIAVISAHGTMDIAIRALKAGAFDFVSKPIELNTLRGLVAAALKLSPALQKGSQKDSPIVGSTKAILDLRKTIAKLARSQAPVHITGESGTGKELVAREIHQLGPRKDQPFVAINCGAIPGELIESELFGHKKGSFTGAVDDHQGLIRSADGGSLFLDEIADLPLHMQVKLLRVIQEKTVRPVGSNEENPVDVRILSATNEDLLANVESGNFRKDLYYRINVIQVDVPNLRSRKKDIPLLVDHIIQGKMSGAKEKQGCRLTGASIEKLSTYHFPGNIRELENILERAAALCESGVIEPEDLLLPDEELERDVVDNPLPDQVQDLEKETILAALENSRWNRTRAAEQLGLTLRQLRYRLKKFGIENSH